MSVGHQEENNTFLAVDVADEVGKRVCRGMRRIYFIALFAISAPIKLHCLIVTRRAIPRKGAALSFCRSAQQIFQHFL